MPLVRRIPKRGFNNRWAKTVVVSKPRRLRTTPSSPATMLHRKRSPTAKLGQRQLRRVEDSWATVTLTKKLKISAHRFSKTATEKIDAAGGEAIVLPGKAPVVKVKTSPKEKAIGSRLARFCAYLAHVIPAGGFDAKPRTHQTQAVHADHKDGSHTMWEKIASSGRFPSCAPRSG